MIRSASRGSQDLEDDEIGMRTISTTGSDGSSFDEVLAVASYASDEHTAGHAKQLKNKFNAWRKSSFRSVKSIGSKRSKDESNEDHQKENNEHGSVLMKKHQSLSKLAFMLRASARIRAQQDRQSDSIQQKSSSESIRIENMQIAEGMWAYSENPTFAGFVPEAKIVDDED